VSHAAASALAALALRFLQKHLADKPRKTDRFRTQFPPDHRIPELALLSLVENEIHHQHHCFQPFFSGPAWLEPGTEFQRPVSSASPEPGVAPFVASGTRNARDLFVLKPHSVRNVRAT